jgi:phage FluMu protein gp41
METPSARLIAAAGAVPALTDPQGRRLSLRRLTALDKLRLYKAAGPALAQNPAWMGIALLAASVDAIDDVPVPAPASEAQIEALVGRLGEAALAAVAEALRPAAASAAEVADAASHFPPTPT